MRSKGRRVSREFFGDVAPSSAGTIVENRGIARQVVNPTRTIHIFHQQITTGDSSTSAITRSHGVGQERTVKIGTPAIVFARVVEEHATIFRIGNDFTQINGLDVIDRMRQVVVDFAARKRVHAGTAIGVFAHIDPVQTVTANRTRRIEAIHDGSDHGNERGNLAGSRDIGEEQGVGLSSDSTGSKGNAQSDFGQFHRISSH